MENTKWLSEAVNTEDIESGVLNLVRSPVGSGKTTWAIDTLSKTVSAPYKMIYLIDTTNGKEQLLKNEKTRYYDWKWQVVNLQNSYWFGDVVFEDKIVVMTYAKFGRLVEQYPEFGYHFELIICDEIHSLPKFCFFSEDNCHKMAKERIEAIIKNTETRVIALSATPQRAEKWMNCPIKYVPVDENVRRLQTCETSFYRNQYSLLKELSPSEKGIVYIGHVHSMKEFCYEALKLGFRAIAIWSTNNKKDPMNAEQLRVREYILNKAELPPEYDLFIINASSETSININGQVDYMVVHSQADESRTQVRGRFRDTLKQLYLLDYRENPVVPEEFLNRELFKEDKESLCEALNCKNENSYKYKWPTVKSYLLDEGYTVIEKRSNNRRYAIILL